MMGGCLVSKLNTHPTEQGHHQSGIFQVKSRMSCTWGNNEACKVRSLFTQLQAISRVALCKIVMTML